MFGFGTMNPFCHDGRWGLLNERGDVLLPPEFDEICSAIEPYPLSYGGEEYLIVKRDDKAGVCMSGAWDRERNVVEKAELVLPFIYDDIFSILQVNDMETDCFIAKRNGKWGIVDVDGVVLLPFDYDEISWPEQICDWSGRPYDDTYCCPPYRGEIRQYTFLCFKQTGEKGNRFSLLSFPELRVMLPNVLTEEPMWMYPGKEGIVAVFVRSNGACGALNEYGHWLIPLQKDKEAFQNAWRKFLHDWKRKRRKMERAETICIERPRKMRFFRKGGRRKWEKRKKRSFSIAKTM